MIVLNPLKLSAKSILLRDLNKTNLHNFYEGLPYRYNSIIDLLFQEKQVKNTILENLQLKDRLFYKVFTLSLPNSSLPILECLEIDGILGGMLSTYLHDFDREIIEGKGDLCISSDSMLVWQTLLEKYQFSFVFRASRASYSRTSNYMKKIGFKERQFGDLRSFFNGTDNSDLFVEVMREFITAIENKSTLYSFNVENFREAKTQQAIIAKKSLLGVANTTR